jgi:hypothetical protein
VKKFFLIKNGSKNIPQLFLILIKIIKIYFLTDFEEKFLVYKILRRSQDGSILFFEGKTMATRLDNDKKTAQESEKTKKAREKLKNRLKKIDSMVTSQAIDEKKDQISDWISRHSWSRDSVTKDDLGLFDQNRNPAPLSKKAQGMKDRLEKDK